jgi:hypothetical protein
MQGVFGRPVIYIIPSFAAFSESLLFGKKPMRDIGIALGVTEAAAKMRARRAVDQLRTQLRRQ